MLNQGLLSYALISGLIFFTSGPMALAQSSKSVDLGTLVQDENRPKLKPQAVPWMPRAKEEKAAPEKPAAKSEYLRSKVTVEMGDVPRGQLENQADEWMRDLKMQLRQNACGKEQFTTFYRPQCYEANNTCEVGFASENCMVVNILMPCPQGQAFNQRNGQGKLAGHFKFCIKVNGAPGGPAFPGAQ